MSVKLLERQDIEELLYNEAALLDDGKFDEWLDLYTEESKYWVPCNDGNRDPNKHVSIIYDDRKRLEERVWRIQSGLAYGQEPRSKTRHLITNVQIVESGINKLIVSSNFILVELRRGKQTVYAGRNEHHLKLEDSTWKIDFKKVELINSNEPLGNLSFLL